MASNITYNGVSSAQGGGNIFRGVSFWVALKVPTRASILKKITDNQGSVVPLEKYADICIADHARKDAPAGSYSWKFITDSVENGIIQLRDRYRIGPAPDVPRPVGAGVHAKGTRVPFTEADDAVLVHWILSHQGDHSGNKIYMELAQTNQRHPWQSWRNRWIKNVSVLPKKRLQQLAAMATAAGNEGDDNATENPPNPDSNRLAVTSRNQGQRRQAPTETASHSRPRNSPRHSLPKPREDIREISHETETSAESEASRESSVPKNRSISREIPAFEKDVTGAIAKQHSRSRPDSVSRDDNPIEGDAELEEDAAADDSSTIAPMEQFYRDLHDYMAANDLEIEMQHHIGGKDLELWDLFEAANTQNVPLEELDWKQVAADLGYHRLRHRHVVGALQKCFEDNLAEFIWAIASFYEENEEDDGEETKEAAQEEINEAVQEEAEDETVAPISHTEEPSPPSYVPSSPPIGIVSRKRSLDIQPSSSGYSVKRGRFDRDATIPSTPDERIGIVRHHLFTQTPSPSLRKSMMRARKSGLQELPPIPQTADERPSTTPTPKGKDVQPTTPRQARPKSSDNPFDTTPPQQPCSEAELHSPIPLRLGTGNTGHTSPLSNEAPHHTKQSQSAQGTRRARMSINAQRIAEGGPSTQPQVQRRTLPASFRLPQSSGQSQQQIPQQHRQQKDSTQHDGDSIDREENRRQISSWKDYYASLGYPHDIVVEALRCTSMEIGDPAVAVMKSLQDGNGIPTHHEGVWTDRDDTSLRLVDSVDANQEPINAEEARQLKRAKKEWDRLVHKHGLERVDLRRRFLGVVAISEQTRRG